MATKWVSVKGEQGAINRRPSGSSAKINLNHLLDDALFRGTTRIDTPTGPRYPELEKICADFIDRFAPRTPEQCRIRSVEHVKWILKKIGGSIEVLDMFTRGDDPTVHKTIRWTGVTIS